MVVGDTARQRGVGVDISAGGETFEGEVEVLSHAKEEHRLENPVLVTCDFSPKIIAAITQVFRPEVINIDGFHVMQLLNNGIRRDLLDFRDVAFQAEARELRALRRWVSQVQEEVKVTGHPAPATPACPPPVDSSHVSSTFCARVAQQVVALASVGIPCEFFAGLQTLLDNLAGEAGVRPRAFCDALLGVMPKRQPTSKGQARVLAMTLRKLEGPVSHFPCRARRGEPGVLPGPLAAVLPTRTVDGNPRAPPVRIPCQVPCPAGIPDYDPARRGVYRVDPAAIDGHQLDDLVPLSHYSAKLQAAISTIKEHRDDILRFVEVFKTHPDLPKRCRANIEPFNLRVKTPFKRGKNCTKRSHLLGRLQLQLGCEVRFQTEEEAVATP